MLEKIKSKWADLSPKLKVVVGVVVAIIIVSIIF
jgi:CRISPR/Cas system-associated protein Cas7 (RAMP superfamily)